MEGTNKGFIKEQGLHILLVIALGALVVGSFINSSRQTNQESQVLTDQNQNSNSKIGVSTNSIVRIIGVKQACNALSKGTGFVVAQDIIFTNAHVVAGVTNPEIDGPHTNKIAGTVIYFNPKNDLALIRVPNLNLPALELGSNATENLKVTIAGYPGGQSQKLVPAVVKRIFNAQMPDIYFKSTALESIYEVDSELDPGFSGSPILDQDGKVRGAIFSNATDKNSTSYGLLPTEITSALTLGGSATFADTNKCITKE